MERKKLTKEEIQKRKESMAKEEDTWVVRNTSLESGDIVRRLNSYDFSVKQLKKYIGRRGYDQKRLLELIDKCNAINASFISLVDELVAFVRNDLISVRPNPQPGTEEQRGDIGDNGNNGTQKAGKRKQAAEAPA